MNRKTFAHRLALIGVCPFMLQRLTANEIPVTRVAGDDELKMVQAQKDFIGNWLSDLLESMEKNLDRKTQERVVGECGVGCFNRHQFKKDIAATNRFLSLK